MSVSSIAAAGIDMPGGMILYGHNKTSLEDISIIFQEGQSHVTLNNGDWDFFVIGWAGPNNMVGSVECGGVFAKLEGGDAEVNITISNAKCLSPGAAEAKFISSNQFLDLTMQSCGTIPVNPIVSSSCSGNLGSLRSFRVKLNSHFIDEAGINIDNSLMSTCYNLTLGSQAVPLLLPFGGSPFSQFETEIEMFNSDGCIGEREKFKFVDGLSNVSNVQVNDSNSRIGIANDGSSISLFVTTPSISPSNSFITRWRTTLAEESITLPLRSGFNYNFVVDWGDGSAHSIITSDSDSDKTHDYALGGNYIVTIQGLVEAWHFNDGGDKDKLLEVNNLGSMGWINFENAFSGCNNLTLLAGGETSSVADFSYMFSQATSVDPDMSSWNFSSADNMSDMFAGVTLSTANYSAMLNQINATFTQNNLILEAGSATFNASAAAAKASLIARGWTISDGGEAAAPIAPPSITGWNVDVNTIGQGQSNPIMVVDTDIVNLTVNATDPNGLPLEYIFYKSVNCMVTGTIQDWSSANSVNYTINASTDTSNCSSIIVGVRNNDGIEQDSATFGDLQQSFTLDIDDGLDPPTITTWDVKINAVSLGSVQAISVVDNDTIDIVINAIDPNNLSLEYSFHKMVGCSLDSTLQSWSSTNTLSYTVNASTDTSNCSSIVVGVRNSDGLDEDSAMFGDLQFPIQLDVSNGTFPPVIDSWSVSLNSAPLGQVGSINVEAGDVIDITVNGNDPYSRPLEYVFFKYVGCSLDTTLQSFSSANTISYTVVAGDNSNCTSIGIGVRNDDGYDADSPLYGDLQFPISLSF